MSALHYAVGCLLALLPGPPRTFIEDALIQPYPVNPSKCKDYDLSRDIVFEVYTRYNRLSPQALRIGDDKLLSESYIDFSLPTAVYFHAFVETANATSGTLMRQAYLTRGDHNIIFVSAARLLAGPWYLTAVQNTWLVGVYSSHFINYLYDRGLSPKMLHLIGLSLGAQVAGVVGKLARWKPARITGLDPALPLFANVPFKYRLDKGDADFVDVIHTDGGILGFRRALGHADFYVNGGISPQPGCELKSVLSRGEILEPIFCSHWRSYLLYIQSVLNPAAFPSIPCGPGNTSCISLRQSKNRRMKRPITYLGIGANPRVHGKFYVETTAKPPYYIVNHKK